MKKYNNIIGIDPDCEKSGVAFLETTTKKLEISNLTFPQLLDYMQFVKKQHDETGQSVVFIVEAGYLNKSNWHVNSGDNRRVATAKGNSTGRNHEVARKIIEMAKHYGLDVIETRPLKKMWKGPDGKITHDELSFFTAISRRTNQEGRDGALLAWNFAGFPMRVRPVTMGSFFNKK
jgi:hypothetical protein